MTVAFEVLWSDVDETEADFRKHGRPISIEIDGDACGFIEIATDEDGYRAGFEIYLEHEELDVAAVAIDGVYDTAGAAKKALRRLVRQHTKTTVKRNARQQELFEEAR